MHFALLPIYADFGYDEEPESGRNMYVRGFLTQQERDGFLKSVFTDYLHLHFDLQPRAASYAEVQQYCLRGKCQWSHRKPYSEDMDSASRFDVLPVDFSIDSERDCMMSMEKYPWLSHVVPTEYQTRAVQLSMCGTIRDNLSTLFYIEHPIPELQRAFLDSLGDGTDKHGELCVAILLTEYEKFDAAVLDEVKPGLSLALQLHSDDNGEERARAVREFLERTAQMQGCPLPEDLILEE